MSNNQMERDLLCQGGAQGKKEQHNNGLEKQKSRSNSPLACICNLCNCGEHSCSNFMLKGESKSNCNNRCQTKNSSSNSKLIMMNEKEEVAYDGSGMSESNDVDVYEKCDCYDRERYLTNLKSNLNKQTKNNNKELNADPDFDDGLLHVLVTRPEIASKPRDNIIFEGDMDLKTTFETSYEALARMRLDHWKKYQELKSNEAPPGCSAVGGKSNVYDNNPRTSKRSKGGCSNRQQFSNKQLELGEKDLLVDNEEEEIVDRIKNGEQKIRKFENSPIMRKNGDTLSPHFDNQQEWNLYEEKGVFDNNNYSDNNYNDVVLKNRKKTMKFAPSAHGEFQQHKNKIDVNNCNNNYNDYKIKTKSPISPYKITDDNDKTTNRLIQSPTRHLEENMMKSGGGPPNTIMDKQQLRKTNESPFIDPDLSPLIVYNANMNRLDTVGLRKRSKYRPSTTLMSGSRGMFGDHEEVKQEQRFEQQQHDKHHHPKEELDSAMTGPTNQNERQSKEPEKLLNKSEKMLSARNLNDSKQPNQLVYSDFNLPVDSKRKVQNNINMIDHIKEQNIVANKQLLLEEQQNSDNIDVNLNILKQNMEDLKLMQAEEEAAFNEIKRFNSPVPIGNEFENENNLTPITSMVVDKNHDYRISELKTNSSSNRASVNDNNRQTKLQRTCQNQNFDIFGCNYPDEAISQDYRIKKQINNNVNNVKRKSPQSRTSTSNNLFRESPDFILTTGKFLYEEAKSLAERKEEEGVKQEQEAKTDLIESNQLANNNNQEHSAVDYAVADDNQSLCRVLNLDKNFQYIGSLSGHKYFVERPNLK